MGEPKIKKSKCSKDTYSLQFSLDLFVVISSHNQTTKSVDYFMLLWPWVKVKVTENGPQHFVLAVLGGANTWSLYLKGTNCSLLLLFPSVYTDLNQVQVIVNKSLYSFWKTMWPYSLDLWKLNQVTDKRATGCLQVTASGLNSWTDN